LSDKDNKTPKDNVLPFRNKEGEQVNLDDMITFKSSPKNKAEIGDELRKSQTAEFVEGVVDDLAIQLIKNFVDLAMKIDRPSFYADLAVLTDIIRGMIYRDFGYTHISQILVDKIVSTVRDKTGNPAPVINYSKVLERSDIVNDEHITPMRERQLELDFEEAGYIDDGPNNIFKSEIDVEFEPDIELPPDDDK
jgi:hypothetical protein|tara:strand:+ start:1615 stop:2193 length:579 start_codon:yes stop_codon:yes gene_type:complete